MLVDLHAHYPMHLIPGEQGHAQTQLARWRAARWRARIVHLISRAFNYQGPGNRPSVTIDLMREGRVGVALSVLYTPFDEIDLTVPYAAPPRSGYFQDVVDQLELVEEEVATHPDAVVVHSGEDLELALSDGKVALVHCIEGGFALGATREEIRANVALLAARGVTYVTVAHLFWRRVATNAPALPFLPQWLYKLLFPQPAGEGLGALGRAAVEAMIEHGIVVDVTHMNQDSLDETLDIVDARDHGGRIPVMSSHGAYRFGDLEYNLSDETIRRIARHGGVIGIIACTHYIAHDLRPKRPRTQADSVSLICAHVDRIAQVTGSFDHVAIGSDLDGYIKPALPGLEHMGRMAELQDRLAQRYGPVDAEKLCSGNALRVLRARFARPLGAVAGT
jgi:microsomal dipeptidase-like Zn-dependent dipeptidase